MVALGSAIDGKWTASTQGRNGTQTETLTLKLNGSTLTGNLDMGRGATEIASGTMDGSTVNFKVTRAGRNGNTTTDYTGKLTGDDLTLTATREGGAAKGSQQLVFKRAK